MVFSFLKSVHWIEFWIWHIGLASILALVGALIFGNLSIFLAIVCLVGSCGVALYFTQKNAQKDLQVAPMSAWLYFPYGFLGLTIILHFIFLCFEKEGRLWTQYANNIGDMPLHIQYIKHLSLGEFWPKNPGYPLDYLRYPFGLDLYNSLWDILGVPLNWHLAITGIVCSFILLAVLHQWGSWWLVFCFFFNGGLANFTAIQDLFYLQQITDYQNAEAWKSLFLSIIITQRGFLFALPAGVLFLKTIITWFEQEKRPLRKEQFKFAFLIGLITFFHVHSAFVLLIFLGFFVMIHRRWTLIPFGVLCFLFALPYVLHASDFFTRASIVSIDWNWTRQSDEPIVWYWLRNFGLMIPLLVLCFRFAIVQRVKQIWLGAVGLSLWIFFSTVMLATWNWDNIKVLVWCYLVLCVFMWPYVRDQLLKKERIIIAFFCFFSGFWALLGSLPGIYKPIEIMSLEQVQNTKSLMEGIPPSEVVACAPSYKHPLIFTGHLMTLGYPAHIWSHGYSWNIVENREKKVDQLYKTGILDEALQVDYVIWGDLERERYGTDQLNKDYFELVKEHNDDRLYRIK